jgi:hypothetical protein
VKRIGVDLCEAWGLDPSRVIRISIYLLPLEERVEVVLVDLGSASLDRLVRYRLVELEATP